MCICGGVLEVGLLTAIFLFFVRKYKAILKFFRRG
jgi:hypothetical protein